MRVVNTPLKPLYRKLFGRYTSLSRYGTAFLALTLSLGIACPVYQTAEAVKTPTPPAPGRHASQVQEIPIPVTGSPLIAPAHEAVMPATAKAPVHKAQPHAGNVPTAQPGVQNVTPVTQPALYVFQPRDLSNEQLQTVTQTLADAAVSYKTVTVMDVKNNKGGYALVPLVRRLDQAELDALRQFSANGGKLFLLPPEDVSDPNIQTLFESLQLPVDTVIYVSQSQDLKLPPAKKGKLSFQGNLPIGTQVLTLKPSQQAQVLALWGEEIPAIVRTPSGVFLNWQWGQELTADTNIGILAELTGITPGKIAKKPQPEENPFGFLLPGYSDASAWVMTPGEFDRNSRILAEYKTNAYDAIETALMLDINLSIKTIQQHLLQGEFEKTRFESFYRLGKFAEAQTAYRQAKGHMLDAIALTSSSPRVEGRAIWLDRGTIVDAGSQAGMRKVMEKLKNTGINVVYFETVNAGFSVYPSKFTKQNPMISGWDPLAAAVEEGHKLGMEVHAWVWCFAVGNRRHNPIIGKSMDYPGPILEDSGMISEALRGPTGNLTPTGKQHEFWLSPASPKARQYLSDLYAEIVNNYDVDGLHLDYIRFPFQKPGNLMGFDAVTRAHFNQSTGLSVDHMSESTYRVWVAWKTYQVSSFVKEISTRMKGIKPNLKLSAAVFPLPRASRIIAIQQDWETWVENGWIDILSPMSYTTSPKVLQKTFETVEQGTKKRALVYPGIAINKLDSEQLLRQLDALREKGALGSTIFAMAHLDDVKVSALGNGPYKEKGIQSPHKDPVNATLSIADEYQDKFNRLLKFQELNGISSEQLGLLQQHLKGFQSSIGALKKASPSTTQTVANDPQISLQTAKTNLLSLDTNAAKWLEQEKTSHPFRYQYFNELLLRLEQMVNYLTAYYQPKQPDNLQANFMMMLEDAKEQAATQMPKVPAAGTTLPVKLSPSPVSPSATLIPATSAVKKAPAIEL